MVQETTAGYRKVRNRGAEFLFTVVFFAIGYPKAILGLFDGDSHLQNNF